MAHEFKATRLDILKLIQAKDVIDIMDLVNQFGYVFSSARQKLYRLEKTKLVEKLGICAGAYFLANEAYRKSE